MTQKTIEFNLNIKKKKKSCWIKLQIIGFVISVARVGGTAVQVCCAFPLFFFLKKRCITNNC